MHLDHGATPEAVGPRTVARRGRSATPVRALAWESAERLWRSRGAPWIDRRHVTHYNDAMIKTFADKRTANLFASGVARGYRRTSSGGPFADSSTSTSRAS